MNFGLHFLLGEFLWSFGQCERRCHLQIGQFCISAFSSVARILNALFVITGGEKDEPQIQMERILSECRIEIMERLAMFRSA